VTAEQAEGSTHSRHPSILGPAPSLIALPPSLRFTGGDRSSFGNCTGV
jgi:hypothetical protein